MTRASTASALLGLPTEVRLLIWEYAFGGAQVPLYLRGGPGSIQLWNESLDCKECLKGVDELPGTSENITISGTTASQIPQLTRAYSDGIESLLICKTIYSEAITLFQSTLTFHIKSSETIAMIRQFAPSYIRHNVTRIVLYIHFTMQNELAWYLRLLDLNNILPNLKHIAVNYHMRPPSTYDNLANAIFLSMPIMSLSAPFNRPLYVIKEEDRSEACSILHNGRRIPCTDSRTGLTIHTAYRQFAILFDSDFLGEITTDDAIDEHTSVICALFTDEAFVAAAEVFLGSDTYHRNLISWGPFKISRTQVPGEVINICGGREMYDALLGVAHDLEKPWFEKLQRRKILQMYMEHRHMSREQAERILDHQVASIGEDAIGRILEMLINGDESLLEAGVFSDA